MEMKIVNERGIAALKAWIEATRGEDELGPLAETDARALDAWCVEAEESMLAGNAPMVEMSELQTRSHLPETFTLPENCIEIVEVRENAEANT